MLTFVTAPFVLARALVKSPKELAVENLALRQQLAVFKYRARKPRPRKTDRIFWVWLSQIWANWRSSLAIVQPETVVKWHQLGFKLYWTWKSKPRKTGRPRIAPRSPWQNPYAEGVIGSIRRECLDQVIVLGEQHFRRIMASYVDYYNNSRLHLSLARDAPVPRRPGARTEGEIVAIPQVGGLHHRYERCA